MKSRTLKGIVISSSIAATGFLLPLSAMAQDNPVSGVELFETHCASCHLGEARGDDRLAPPAFAVQNHYFGQYNTEEAFVSAVVRWLEEPSEDKALMPGAVSKFGLMPPVDLTDDERLALGQFLFNAKFDIPGWYEEHYREEHGEAPPSGGMGMMGHGHGEGMGQGKGMGQGRGMGHKRMMQE